MDDWQQHSDDTAQLTADPVALLSDDSVTLLYGHIRHIARRFRSEGFYSDSLAATDLAHEALTKLLGGMRDYPFESEEHVLNMAAKAMHRLLIDRLRRRELRAAALEEVRRNMTDLTARAASEPGVLHAFADHVEQLERRRPRSANVVRYRFFFRMTLAEIAEQLDSSVSTVHRELAYARAYLVRAGL